MNCNSEIYQIAIGYLRIAELAQEKAVEIDEFRFAYTVNLAFSIELFLKSLKATSGKITLGEIDGAKHVVIFAESTLRGHDPSKLFELLSEQTKKELRNAFRAHSCNF